jgi:hypothetical protein
MHHIIDLNDRCRLVFRETADGYCGLHEVTVDGVPLRNPRLPIQPVWATPSGLLFDRLKWQGASATTDGYEIRFSAPGSVQLPFQEWFDVSRDWMINESDWSGPAPAADIVLRLTCRDVTVEGTRYAGFSMQWNFACPGAAVHWGLERGTWELGGAMDRGNYLLARTLTSPPVTELTQQAAYTSYGPMIPGMPGQLWARGSLHAVFDLQCGADGTLVRYYPPAPLVRSSLSKATGDDVCKHMDLHLFELGEAAVGTQCCILYAPGAVTAPHARCNRWLEWQRHSQAEWCAATGIEARKPVPTIYHAFWEHYRFEDYTPIPAIVAKLGFARLLVHDAIWSSDREQVEGLKLDGKTHGLANKCCTWDWDPSNFRGGPEPLREVKRNADAVNIELWYWFACHLSVNSPLVKEHPEWQVMWKNRCLTDGGYTVLAPVDLNNPAVYDRIIEKLLAARDTAGQHGFFWDSVSNLAWWQVNYADPQLRPHLPAFLRLVRQLQEAELDFAFEALCVFAPSTIGYRDFYQIFQGGNECFAMDVMLRSVEYPASFLADGTWNHEMYFRFLAHRAIPLLSFYSDDDLKRGLHPNRKLDLATGEFARTGTFPPPVEELDLVRHFDATFQSFNRAYMAVLADMDRLALLPDGQGTEWRSHADPGQRIVWSFRAGSVAVPVGANIEEMRSGRPVTVSDGKFAAERFGVYRITEGG